MPLMDSQFEEQFEKLQAAFSVTKTKKIASDWFDEFEECEHEYFCRAMRKLQRGDKFPNWGMVWAEYRNCQGPAGRREETSSLFKSCGVCNNGQIFYRALNRKTGEVKDRVGCCLKCAPDMPGFGKVNPDWLHKDKVGVYRLRDALKVDRLPTKVKWPQFMIDNWKAAHPSKKLKIPEDPPHLSPQNDPDFEMVVVEVRKPDVKMLAQEIAGGKDDPGKEKIRQERKREVEQVPY